MLTWALVKRKRKSRLALVCPLASEDEVKAKKSIQQDLWDASNAYESLLRQKSRAKWIKEGDSNSAYFHKVINFRRNYNASQGLLIDGV